MGHHARSDPYHPCDHVTILFYFIKQLHRKSKGNVYKFRRSKKNSLGLMYDNDSSSCQYSNGSTTIETSEWETILQRPSIVEKIKSKSKNKDNDYRSTATDVDSTDVESTNTCADLSPGYSECSNVNDSPGLLGQVVDVQKLMNELELSPYMAEGNTDYRTSCFEPPGNESRLVDKNPALPKRAKLDVDSP